MSTPSDLLEQYKAILEDIGRLGERYESGKNFYVTVLSAFCGFLGLAAGDVSVLKVSWWVLWLIAGAGVAVCWMWIIHTRSVTLLFAIKFRLLAEMEKQGVLYPAFQLETQWLFDAASRPEHVTKAKYMKITDTNVTIAKVFMALFILIPLINSLSLLLCRAGCCLN